METANPHPSPHSSPGRCDQLNLSHVSSARDLGANGFTSCTQEDETNFKPPLNVIVFQATPTSSSLPTPNHHYSSAGQHNSAARSAGSTVLSRARTKQDFSGSGSGQMPSVSSFRLQPRHPAKCIPSPSRSMCSRGRKRRAYSISTPEKVAEGADSSVATETTFRESSLGTPMQDSQYLYSPRQPYMDAAMATFQGLSLQSPVRHVLPGSTELETGSPASLFSQASMARSCFSKYNSTSPAGSLNLTSPCSPVHSSSPRIAPLTVLATNFSSTASTSQLTEAAAALASPTFSSMRPPLHGGMAAFMQSLDESASRNVFPTGSTTPPRSQFPNTVHCNHQQTTPESTLSHETTTGTADAVPLPHLETPSKKSRTYMIDSPGKRSVTSKSATSTPVPRLTLTPRSTSNRPREIFAQLSMPSDLGDTVNSPEACSQVPVTCTGETGAGTVQEFTPLRRQLSPRKSSYIPLPDWGEPKALTESSYVPRSMFYHESTSLLAPPSRDDAIEQYLQATNNNACCGDSLSASDDDDETFFLAAPSVIHEEKQANMCQTKHRKLRALEEAFHSRPSFASSILASNTSLRGMNFVTSSTSLDKEGFKLGVAGMPEPHASNMHRLDSESSIGLPLEGTSAPSPEESTIPTVDRSSATRDLVTPPVMAQPKSPPPLSPRIHYLSTSIGSLPPRSSVRYHCGTSPPWPCSGEAESPMSSFTRKMFTSTDPDGSPRTG